MVDVWKGREPGKRWTVVAAGTVAGGLTALCASGWIGAAALVVALVGVGYIIQHALSEGDPITRVTSVVAYLGVLLALGAAVGLGSRLVFTGMHHRLAGTPVIAHVTGECDFQGGDGRRRGGRGIDIVCPGATWTAGGRAVTGTVEVAAEDLPGPGVAFDVRAWAIGDRATSAAEMSDYPVWMRPPLLAPWWLIGVGLVVAFVATGVSGRVSERRRQSLAAANGWEYRASGPELPGVLPLDPGTIASATRVISGVRDGLPFLIFDYHNGKVAQTVYAVQALPFELDRGGLGPYRVQGRWVMRAGAAGIPATALLRGLDEVRAFALQLITAAREQRLDELLQQFEPGRSAGKP